jgi:hypothetical protein
LASRVQGSVNILDAYNDVGLTSLYPLAWDLIPNLATPCLEPSAINPYNYRKLLNLLSHSSNRCPYVQREAVLRSFPASDEEVSRVDVVNGGNCALILRARRTELRCINTTDRRLSSWRCPSKLVYGWLGKRDAEELSHAGGRDVVPFMRPYTGPTVVSTFNGVLAKQASNTDDAVRRNSSALPQLWFLHIIVTIVEME